jgi:glycosyltransferase involved in cell wall biosynthesis
MSTPAADTVSRAPTRDDLPSPPEDNTGWPWTKQSAPLPDTQPEGTPWPKISIVTPSYNQGQFIEETIRSVLLQGYPNLEYIVIDGGSTDGTVDVLEKYDPWIDHWVSESDDGQSDAINKGLCKCTGTIFNWLNADDLLVPHALRRIGEAMGGHDVLAAQGWRMDERRTNLHQFSDFTCEGLIIGHADSSGSMFTQQAVWLRTDQVKECGGVDPDIEYAMDQDLYIRYTRQFDNVCYLDRPVSVFRLHEDSKTGQATDHFRESQQRILEKLARDPKFESKRDLIQWSRERLSWRRSVIQLQRSGAPTYEKVVALVGGILRDPLHRIDRPTLGALKNIILEVVTTE